MHSTEIFKNRLQSLNPLQIFGKVVSVQGLVVRATYCGPHITIGGHCVIHTSADKKLAQIIRFDENHAYIMPFDNLTGINPGNDVLFHPHMPVVHPALQWRGRVINSLCEPIDDKGPLVPGGLPYPLHPSPLVASRRARIQDPLDVGVRAINTFLTLCKGQRMGIFAGSGVGKSMLLSMLTRFTPCDVCIIGLIGERGREVKEFIEETLGPDGLQKTIMVVSTSDDTALMRRQGAYLTLTLCEFFRDQGLSVLCLMDSLTRFAMAQREIGLSAGEPPATKGYPPSVFSLLPQLLERAGPGLEGPSTGFITGLFTVLVEGDDTNEPIADTVRSIVDGHIVLSRDIAERGRYPAIHISKSISRATPACYTPEQHQWVKKARLLLSQYEEMADMIRLGAYKMGDNPELDKAIHVMPALEAFLNQDMNEQTSLSDAFAQLEHLLS